MSVNKHISRDELEDKITVFASQVENRVAVLEELRTEIRSELEREYTYKNYEREAALSYAIDILNGVKGWLIELYEGKN